MWPSTSGPLPRRAVVILEIQYALLQYEPFTAHSSSACLRPDQDICWPRYPIRHPQQSSQLRYFRGAGLGIKESRKQIPPRDARDNNLDIFRNSCDYLTSIRRAYAAYTFPPRYTRLIHV